MTEPRDRNRDKINIDVDTHEVYTELTTGGDAVFRTMKDVFLLAAAVGFRRSRREKLKRRQSIFGWAQFNSQEDVPLVKALALAAARDIKILGDRDQMLEVVEEFANGGILHLRAELTKPGDPLVNAVALLAEGHTSSV